MKAIIEMPKGDTRRRHLASDKHGIIDLGLLRDSVPVHGGVMPVHYGYLPGTRNHDEGDEIDVLIYSPDAMAIGQEADVRPIALFRRGDKDDKVVAVRASDQIISSWEDIPKTERDLLEQFFGYHHKIVAIENAEAARRYVEENQEQAHS